MLRKRSHYCRYFQKFNDKLIVRDILFLEVMSDDCNWTEYQDVP
jgi:hypothetical protein